MELESHLDLSREEMREMGYRAIDILVEHFATLKDQRVGAKADPSKIFQKLSEPPPDQGTPYQPLRSAATGHFSKHHARESPQILRVRARTG